MFGTKFPAPPPPPLETYSKAPMSQGELLTVPIQSVLKENMLSEDKFVPLSFAEVSLEDNLPSRKLVDWKVTDLEYWLLLPPVGKDDLSVQQYVYVEKHTPSSVCIALKIQLVTFILVVPEASKALYPVEKEQLYAVNLS
jgi:hypothetical protein